MSTIFYMLLLLSAVPTAILVTLKIREDFKYPARIAGSLLDPFLVAALLLIVVSVLLGAAGLRDTGSTILWYISLTVFVVNIGVLIFGVVGAHLVSTSINAFANRQRVEALQKSNHFEAYWLDNVDSYPYVLLTKAPIADLPQLSDATSPEDDYFEWSAEGNLVWHARSKQSSPPDYKDYHTNELKGALVFVFATYEKDSIWSANYNQFITIPTISSLDTTSHDIALTIRGKQSIFHYERASGDDVRRLIQNPMGKTLISRVTDPRNSKEEMEFLKSIADSIATPPGVQPLNQEPPL